MQYGGSCYLCYWGGVGNGALLPVYAFVLRSVSCLSELAEKSKPPFHDSAIFFLCTASLKPPAPELSAFSSSSVPSLHPF